MKTSSPRENDSTFFDELDNPDLSRLAPSKIGSQFYCEKKVDLTKKYGDVPTPEKKKGSETHEKAAEDAEELTREELWDAIESGDPTVILETFFTVKVGEFLFVGIPDAILFDDSQPRLLFDRKTTARPNRLYDNQRIQVWLYGYLLDRLGFDTDRLQIVILSHIRELDPETAKDLQQKAFASYSELGNGEHELLPGAIVHIFEYSPLDHFEELHWAMGYWREERDPIPTTIEAKCRSCEYREKCPDTLT